MKSKRTSGFTLIEVVIAFAILALVLSVIFQSLSSGMSHERTAMLATARVLESRSILDRLGADIPIEEGEVEGQLATGEDWTLTVAPVEFAENEELQDGVLKAFLAELSVKGADGRSLHLQQLVLRP